MKLDLQQTKTTHVCIGHEELKIKNSKRCYQKFIEGEWREVELKDLKKSDIFQDSRGFLWIANQDARYHETFGEFFILCDKFLKRCSDGIQAELF